MTIGRIPSVEGGIQPTIVDAKGDLIAATAADTVNRLAVGSNDQVLVADSSTSTGLAWKSVATPFAAGKNKIINGDFAINQRNFTSVTTTNTHGYDLWRLGASDGTVTFSAQTFTPGTAPVAGYEGKNFAQIVTTGQTATSAHGLLAQRIESVRTLAGQTATISFWAKANTGTPKIALDVRQRFGTGGSPSSNVSTYGGQATLSTSWARYSLTVSIPSLSGITLGTNNDDALEINLWVSAGSDFNARTGSLGIQSNTFQIWGVQVEAGSVATPFTTATGTLQGELQLAQRYYWRSTGSASSLYALFVPAGYFSSTTVFNANVLFPVTMRTTPTSVDFGNLTVQDNTAALFPITAITMDGNLDTPYGAGLVCTVTGATAQRTGRVLGDNSATAHLGFSAEL